MYMHVCVYIYICIYVLKIVKTIKYAQNSYLEKILKVKNRPPGGAVDQSAMPHPCIQGGPHVATLMPKGVQGFEEY